MKTQLSRPLTTILIAGLLSLSSALGAAESAPAEGERGAAARERFQALTAELNLTSEQKQKLTPIVREEMERMAVLRSDQGLTPREKLQRLREIQQELAPQVKAILTPEQFARWEKKRAEARDEMQERLRQRKKS